MVPPAKQSKGKRALTAAANRRRASGTPAPTLDATKLTRLAYARAIMGAWSTSGLPFMATVTPGYDAHLVFPDSGVYGFNREWRQHQTRLALEFAHGGLSVDTFNAYTEGSVIPPTVEAGHVHREWLRDILTRLRRGAV